ncbi:MAG: DUF3048 domain-containing protein [Clostridia bacterium]|nr:DUF3048 domain-containing protein [Clostridia bacterium]
MSSKKILALILAALITGAAFYGCNNDSKAPENPDADTQITEQDNSGMSPDTTDSSQSTDTVEDEVATDAAANPERELAEESDANEESPEIPEVLFRSKLTGLETTEELVNQRPVAIMFNNLKASLPQHGIGEMEIVYEAIVEGSITRLMGVATDWANLPTLGSVRSSRDYYIDFADAHNAIYVHAGGSELAYGVLRSRKTNNIDGTNGTYASTKAFYRNKDRLNKGVSMEHTLFTDGPALAKAIEGNKYATALNEGFTSPLLFLDSEIISEGDTAEYIYVPFSTYAQSYFDYDKESKVYYKGQYLSSKSSLDKHDSPHIDGNTNEQLSFKNVIVLFASYSTVDSAGRQALQFTGSGKGYYFSLGTLREIRWEKASRTSPYTLYEADGETKLLINQGKSYIGMVKPGTDVVYK